MKKKLSIILFLFISLMPLMSHSRITLSVYVMNKTNSNISIYVTVFPYLIIRLPRGELIPSLEFLEPYQGGIFLGWDNSPYVLNPGQETTCYHCDRYSPKEIAFSELHPLEQFKMIYESFVIYDENGTELLNLDTLKEDDFVLKSTAKWYLEIK